MFYSPNNNDGVNALIADLVAEYPDIKATGVANSAEILDEYSQNLFDTWAAIEFDLNSDQQSTGQLVTSTTSPVTVSYSILISPSVWDYTISTTEFTEGVYNDQMGETDTFWQTGYLTLQNFISTNLAKQYTGVPDDFTVRTTLMQQ